MTDKEKSRFQDPTKASTFRAPDLGFSHDLEKPTYHEQLGANSVKVTRSETFTPRTTESIKEIRERPPVSVTTNRYKNLEGNRE